MTTNEQARVPWPFARHLADQIVAELTPLCDRIEIAGSVRRCKETVKDIEILVIPKYGPQPLDMLGHPIGSQPDLLADYLWDSPLWRRRPNSKGSETFGPLNKYMLRNSIHIGGAMPAWMPVDIFTGSAVNWGRDLWLRTGPAQWGEETGRLAMRRGGRFHAYGPYAFTKGKAPAYTEAVACPDEASFAKWLRVPLLPPEQRTDETARTALT